MKIRIERSGGVAGIVISNEMEAESLPSSMKNKIQEILNDREPKSMKMSIPKGSANHFNYRIMFQDGRNDRIIECNQYNMEDDLKNLVRYIETHSN